MLYIGHSQQTQLGEIWVAMTDIGLAAISFPVSEIEFSSRLRLQLLVLLQILPVRMMDFQLPQLYMCLKTL